MNDRFKFRAVLKTDRFSILVEPFYILEDCYFIDINKAEVEFECKYPEVCFWDFIDEIKKQDYIQEIASDADLIITKDFTNLIQCTGLKDKNGNLIYEGDIIKCYFMNDDTGMLDYDIMKVIFDTKAAAFGLIGLKTKNIEYFSDFEFDPKEYKVIGNIFENMRLLNDR